MEQGRDNRRGRADGPRHILKPGKVDLLSPSSDVIIHHYISYCSI